MSVYVHHHHPIMTRWQLMTAAASPQTGWSWLILVDPGLHPDGLKFSLWMSRWTFSLSKLHVRRLQEKTCFTGLLRFLDDHTELPVLVNHLKDTSCKNGDLWDLIGCRSDDSLERRGICWWTNKQIKNIKDQELNPEEPHNLLSPLLKGWSCCSVSAACGRRQLFANTLATTTSEDANIVLLYGLFCCP